MTPQKIIDSHIHLWPEETSNEASHAWMTPPDMPLAKPHLLPNYYEASEQEGTRDVSVRGVVYVETDVRYDTPNGDVASWAKGPLDEISFLRRVIEGKYDRRDTDTLLAVVPWAPMDQATSVLEEYLSLAEHRAGPEAWQRVKGFRYLLQFIDNRSDFERLVLSEPFLANLKLLGRRGFSFDIGVDQHRAGSWQLETVGKAMEMAHAAVPENDKIIFIANHLCKPQYEQEGVSPPSSASGRGALDEWCDAITALSRCSRTYMKLSGQFSELPSVTGSADGIAHRIKPWLKHVFSTFGPERTMFGSDWPVCNVDGPAGPNSWVAWNDVVKCALADEAYALSDADRERIWHGTAAEAYRIG